MTAQASVLKSERPFGLRVVATLYVVLIIVGMLSLIAGHILAGHSTGYVFGSLWRDFVFGYVPLLIGGVGLWFGAKVGWWLSAYGVTRNFAILIINLIFYPGFVAVYSTFEYSEAVLYVLVGINLVVSSCFLGYLFRRRVRSFFELDNFSTYTLVGILTAVSTSSVFAQRLLQKLVG